MQGVAFNSLGAGVGFSVVDNRGNFSSSPNPVTFVGSSPNDTALLSVINEGLQFSDINGGLNIEVTITGLHPNTAYTADSIVTLYGNYAPRSESIAYNGTTAVPLVSLTPDAKAYDVHSLTTSDGSGKLVVDYNGVSGDGPVLTAFVLSVATPEPCLCSPYAVFCVKAADRRAPPKSLIRHSQSHSRVKSHIGLMCADRARTTNSDVSDLTPHNSLVLRLLPQGVASRSRSLAGNSGPTSSLWFAQRQFDQRFAILPKQNVRSRSGSADRTIA